jgi:hypothetical protein
MLRACASITFTTVAFAAFWAWLAASDVIKHRFFHTL